MQILLTKILRPIWLGDKLLTGDARIHPLQGPNNGTDESQILLALKKHTWSKAQLPAQHGFNPVHERSALHFYGLELEVVVLHSFLPSTHEQAVHELDVAEHSMSPVHWRPELDEHVFGSFENVIVVHFSWPSTMEQVVHESGVAEHSMSSSHRRPELDEHVSESFQSLTVVHFS